MTKSLDLALHHVGGRGGTRRFPVLPTFESDVVNVLYEGDPACIEEMDAASGNLASRSVNLADCIGEAPGVGTLKLYRDCGASSLLPFNDTYQNRFLALGWDGIDHQASAFDIIRTVDVDLVTLDDALARRKDRVPSPDYLSLNVQGVELEIMRGAPETLRHHTLVLQVEASLFEIYDGQANLTDILRHAESFGFLASQIVQLGAWVPSFVVDGKSIRPPVGLRLGGMALQVDVVFFKEPKAILAHHENPQLEMVKAVFLAVALKNYSMSYVYGSLVDREFLASLPKGEKHYIDFVVDYLGAVDRQPAFPALDFIATDHAIGEKPVGVQAIRKAYFEIADREAFLSHAPRLFESEHTDVETVCLSYGLPVSADLLRSARIGGMRSICSLLGVLQADGLTLDPAAFSTL